MYTGAIFYYRRVFDLKIFRKIVSILLASVMIIGFNFSVCANGVSKTRIVELLNDIKVENGPKEYRLFKHSYTDSVVDIVAQILCDMQVTENELVAENKLNLFESFKNELQEQGCIWDADKIGATIKIMFDIIQRSRFSSGYKLINHYEIGEVAVIVNIQYAEDMPERRYYSFLSNDEMKQQLNFESCHNSRNFNLSAFNKAIAEFCWGISVDELVDNKNYKNELMDLLKFTSEFVDGNIDDLPYKYTDIDLSPEQYKQLNKALVDRFMEYYNLIDKHCYKISYDDKTGYIKCIDKSWLGWGCNRCICS